MDNNAPPRVDQLPSQTVRIDLESGQYIQISGSAGRPSIAELTSNLHIVEGDEDYEAEYRDDWNRAIDGIESLVLSCHGQGINVASPEFTAALKETLEALANSC